MSSEPPRLSLARHGDTAWTDSRQRTSRACELGERLRRFRFASVFTSPLIARPRE